MEIGIWALGVGFLLLALALALWLRARDLQEQTGLPTGRVIYTDTATWFPNQEMLRSMALQLVGKPDYLVEQKDGRIVPVEVKSGPAPDEPWEGHLLQLAAYCLLVEENYGLRPDYGILQYEDHAYAIDYTAELEDELLDVLAEMREGLFEQELNRDHEIPALCASCGVRSSCNQRLV